jgi:hypothetical protein
MITGNDHRKIFAAAVNPTPGFVSSTVSGSTENDSVTTLFSGTTTCNNTNYTFCTQYADPTLAGNSGVLFVTYGASSQEAPTVTDDKSNTYTHASCTAHDSTNNRWAEVYYSIGLTTGTRQITVTFPTTVTNAQVQVQQLYNIGSYDSCSQNASGSSVTSFTAGSLTTTAGNDWVGVFTVQTNPTNTTSTNNSLGPFAADSGWNQTSNDLREGAASAWEVDASSGTITPKMTSSASAAYVGVSVALKSATAGNAPSGMYISCIGSYNSTASLANTVTTAQEGMPCTPVSGSGSLLFVDIQGGTFSNDPLAITGISDGTNTWAQCGITTTTGTGGPWTSTWYASNPTLINSEAPTFTINPNGTAYDISLWWYVVSGTNTTGGCDAYPITDTGSNVTTGSTFTITSTYQTAASSAMIFNQMGTQQNTPVSLTSPSVLFDTTINAGENLNGPWPLDENNARGHFQTSNSNSAQTWTYGLTSSTTQLSVWASTFAAFPLPGAVWMKDKAVTAEATGTASDVQASITTTASSTLAVAVDLYSSTVRTISSVKLDGNTSCSTGTALNLVSNTTTTGVSGSQGATAIYYLTGVSAAAHTITACASGAMVGGHFDIAVYPVINISATDGTATANQNSSVSAGAATASGVTTTATKGFCLSIFSVSNLVTASPASGNAYTTGSGIFTSTDAWAGLISTSAASHAPAVSDSSGTFNASNACFQ